MMFLLDSKESDFEIAPQELASDQIGQLLTPLTRRRLFTDRFAIDNGCFKNFERDNWLSLLERERPNRERCLFVAVPDVVEDARRTMECFRAWYPRLHGWPIALVAQDGMEDIDIPWSIIDAIFIGGSTRWKCGPAAKAIVRAAKIIGKWAHIGRVNTPERVEVFDELGADSCDGTGISQYSWMRQRIAGVREHPKLEFAESLNERDQ